MCGGRREGGRHSISGGSRFGTRRSIESQPNAIEPPTVPRSKTSRLRPKPMVPDNSPLYHLPFLHRFCCHTCEHAWSNALSHARFYSSEEKEKKNRSASAAQTRQLFLAAVCTAAAERQVLLSHRLARSIFSQVHA